MLLLCLFNTLTHRTRTRTLITNLGVAPLWGRALARMRKRMRTDAFTPLTRSERRTPIPHMTHSHAHMLMRTNHIHAHLHTCSHTYRSNKSDNRGHKLRLRLKLRAGHSHTHTLHSHTYMPHHIHAHMHPLTEATKVITAPMTPGCGWNCAGL